MDGLPSDIDLTFFLGLQVERVCFNVNQLFVRFGANVELSIESECELSLLGGEQLRVSDYRSAATSICALVGRDVLCAARTTTGGLVLSFEGGSEIRILNSSSCYESFQLRSGGAFYVA